MSIKKGLLIFPILTDLGKTDGITIKNKGIRQGFLQNGVDVDVLEFNTNGIFNRDELIFPFHKGKFRRAFDYYFRAWSRLGAYVAGKHYDFIWFRLPLINPAIAGFIRKLKTSDPGCRIILEYGAYPFENELTSKAKLYYRINKPSEKRAHRHADFVITYCGQKEVDGVPNIPINNGIDLTPIPLVQPSFSGSGVRFISVSSLKKWHALERWVLGMADYAAKPGAADIHFDIVGNGSELEMIKNIVQQKGLESQVTFHYFKAGKELDEIYDRAHVAVGTLGFHRIGITNSSSLKNREYVARGLPLVLSTADEDMPASLPFVLYVPEGEEPVDIASVVAFARQAYQRPALNEEIRKYAENHVSWDSKIRQVISFIDKVPATNPTRAAYQEL